MTLNALKWTQRDICISHHWVKGKKVMLNSFRHKGYWYHGKSRELQTMKMFGKLIEEGNKVIEVGGHIGYISTYFSHLVGESGQVLVFEPGLNNLRYIRENIRSCKNVTLMENGVGSESGVLMFYEDSLTGQNNSFIKDFDGLKVNQKHAFTEVEVNERKVAIVTLDSTLKQMHPDFIKIDVEGFEYSVLLGALKTLEYYPIIMVEVQADQENILKLMTSKGYVLMNELGDICTKPSELIANIFCIYPPKHREKINLFDHSK